MSNSYGATGIPEGAQFGQYDTINGEWTGFWFNNREEAEEWVRTQDDKGSETGEDWTEDERLAVVSTTDDEDYI